MSKLQTVISRIVADQKFREALVDDPEDTLRSVGIEPTAPLLAAFEGLDNETMKALIETFNVPC